MTTFADVSHHQGVVDLAAYKAAGHDRIVMKATEGDGFTDSRFSSNWQRAGQLGLARVAYCFAEAQDNGADDFDHLIAVVTAAGGLRPRDRLCLDVEDVDDGTKDYVRAQSHVREFTTRAAARGYKQGLIYTGRWYANPAHVDPTDMPPGWRNLWISHYDTSVSDSQILLPAGWTRDQVVARQFTDRATVAGVAGTCDYSRLLDDWLTSTTPVPAPGPVHPDEEDELFPIEIRGAGSVALFFPASGHAETFKTPDERSAVGKVVAGARAGVGVDLSATEYGLVRGFLDRVGA